MKNRRNNNMMMKILELSNKDILPGSTAGDYPPPLDPTRSDAKIASEIRDIIRQNKGHPPLGLSEVAKKLQVDVNRIRTAMKLLEKAGLPRYIAVQKNDAVSLQGRESTSGVKNSCVTSENDKGCKIDVDLDAQTFAGSSSTQHNAHTSPTEDAINEEICKQRFGLIDHSPQWDHSRSYTVIEDTVAVEIIDRFKQAKVPTLRLSEVTREMKVDETRILAAIPLLAKAGFLHRYIPPKKDEVNLQGNQSTSGVQNSGLISENEKGCQMDVVDLDAQPFAESSSTQDNAHASPTEAINEDTCKQGSLLIDAGLDENPSPGPVVPLNADLDFEFDKLDGWDEIGAMEFGTYWEILNDPEARRKNSMTSTETLDDDAARRKLPKISTSQGNVTSAWNVVPDFNTGDESIEEDIFHTKSEVALSDSLISYDKEPPANDVSNLQTGDDSTVADTFLKNYKVSSLDFLVSSDKDPPADDVSNVQTGNDSSAEDTCSTKSGEAEVDSWFSFDNEPPADDTK